MVQKEGTHNYPIPLVRAEELIYFPPLHRACEGVDYFQLHVCLKLIFAPFSSGHPTVSRSWGHPRLLVRINIMIHDCVRKRAGPKSSVRRKFRLATNHPGPFREACLHGPKNDETENKSPKLLR